MRGRAIFCISTLDNVLMRVCAGVHNAPHYVLYSSMRRQKKEVRGEALK